MLTGKRLACALITYVLGTIFCGLGVAQPLEVAEPDGWAVPAPPPNQEILDALAAAAAALDSDQDGYDEVGAYAIIRNLRLSRENHIIGPQIVYFLDNHSDDDAAWQAMVQVMGWLRIIAGDLLNQGMPLFASQNQVRKDVLREVVDLRTPGFKGEIGSRGVSAFETVLKWYAETERPVPSPVVRLMYELDPYEATRVMSNIHWDNRAEWRRINWATIVVQSDRYKRDWDEDTDPDVGGPEAMSKLDWMSQHGEWWVRLFVAELIRQQAAYRTPELVARLENDANPLVANAVHHAYWWPGGE